MEVVNREEFEAVHDICCEEESPARDFLARRITGMAATNSDALAFGFRMLEACEDDAIVLS